LSVNVATGVISGTVSVTARSFPLVVTVTDSSSPQQNASATLTLVLGAATPTIVQGPMGRALACRPPW
jgi:hypothetical protein